GEDVLFAENRRALLLHDIFRQAHNRVLRVVGFAQGGEILLGVWRGGGGGPGGVCAGGREAGARRRGEGAGRGSVVGGAVVWWGGVCADAGRRWWTQPAPRRPRASRQSDLLQPPGRAEFARSRSPSRGRAAARQVGSGEAWGNRNLRPGPVPRNRGKERRDG